MGKKLLLKSIPEPLRIFFVLDILQSIDYIAEGLQILFFSWDIKPEVFENHFSAFLQRQDTTQQSLETVVLRATRGNLSSYTAKFPEERFLLGSF